MRFRSFLNGGLKVVAACCVGNTFFTLVGYPACVNGNSMQPTLNEDMSKQRALYEDKLLFPKTLDLFQNDWVFVNCWKAREIHQDPNSLSRGELVVFVSPKDPNDSVIKRVLATENDVVTTITSDKNDHTVIIPKGHCWVEGDNAKSSIDSRKYGPISVGLVFGVASHIIFPFRRFRKLNASEDKKAKKDVSLTQVITTKS